MANPFFSDAELEALKHPAKAGSAPEKYSPEWLKAMERPVYIFGCGICGSWVHARLTPLGLPMGGWLDNAQNKRGKIVGGLPVFSPEEMATRIRTDNALVVISMLRTDFADQVAEQCRDLGFDCVDWVAVWQFFERRAAPAELAENENAIRAGGLWSDDASRRAFRDVVRYRTTLRPDDMPELTLPQYFIEEIPKRKLRRFVDVGAYNGDTLRDYLFATGGDFDSYYAFEPLAKCRDALGEYSRRDPRIRVYPNGVADFVGKSRIFEADTASHLTEAGGVEVAVTTLDQALRGERVDYIKMDIEGFEPAALRGAEELIRRRRPVLGISVYHDASHLWQIPEWILGLGLGYRLLLRHHSKFLTETVCYALPDDLHPLQE